jgi:F-type H+-transporting ATPase subunit alpha
MKSNLRPIEHLSNWVDRYRFGLRIGEKGYVASVGDGIVWVYGLSSASSEEIVIFEDGSRGMVFELQKDRLGVILLDPNASVVSGSSVFHTKTRLEIGVGDALLGRIVDPLGKPLDALGEIKTDGLMPLERSSPPIIARDFVDTPLYTGIKAIDTLIPIGRGQRQLVVGDLGTGKSSLALDCVIAQAEEGVKCVYVMIGQKRSDIAFLIDMLRRRGALKYTVVVVAEATATPGMKYLAPFAGCAVAEAWMQKGEDVLIVYDDLSIHARAYRELSLLMHRPPGREAYPGDIFYLHARLLERGTHLNPEYGGGSMTALALVETEEGEIASYIPTNLISITDGQIYLNRKLFAAGILPAVDISLSVSRIGGKAQHPRIKKEAGQIKLDYLQFLELELFSRFGTKLEAEGEAKLRKGRILREILKQDRFSPVSAVFELAWLIAYNAGMLEFSDISQLQKTMTKLQEATKKAPLSLDAPNEEWVEYIKSTLEERHEQQ